MSLTQTVQRFLLLLISSYCFLSLWARSRPVNTSVPMETKEGGVGKRQPGQFFSGPAPGHFGSS